MIFKYQAHSARARRDRPFHGELSGMDISLRVNEPEYRLACCFVQLTRDRELDQVDTDSGGRVSAQTAFLRLSENAKASRKPIYIAAPRVR
jgi:hypothetical protein